MQFLIIILLGTLMQLSSTTNDIPIEEYNKHIGNLLNLTIFQQTLNDDHNNISEIFNNPDLNNTRGLQEKCDEYEMVRRNYIENITQINYFIDKYNLSALRPTLKTHRILNVDRLNQSLYLTLIRCNVTIRKMFLVEDLDRLYESNQEANKISNRIDYKNATIKLSDIRNIAIPKKEFILEKIHEDLKEVHSIKEYCEEHNEVEVCNTSILDVNYWELLQNNVTDDLLKLKNVLVVHIIVTYVQPILYTLVFISGFIGNTVLLIIFFRYKKFRKPQNMIILNFALADTLSLIINLPLYHAFEKIGRGDESTILLSQIFHFSRYLCLGLSAFSTVALCLQRFSATLKASNYMGFILRQSTTDSAKKIITIIWIFAIIFAIPRGVNGGIYIYEHFKSKENTYEMSLRVVTTIELIVLSIIPFAIISILSWFTVRHFQERVSRIPADIPKLHKMYQLEVLSRSTTVIMLTPLLFACTSLPFFLFYSLRNFFELDINSLPDTVMRVISITLLFLSCSFNPIGLYVASGNFRRCMREMFGLGPRKSSLKYTQPQPSKGASSDNDTLDTYL